MPLLDHIVKVHDVFSRRGHRRSDRNLTPIDHMTRNKVLLLYRDVDSGTLGNYAGASAGWLWWEVHNLLEHQLGRPVLSSQLQSYGSLDHGTVPNDLFMFLAECTTEEFLDFIELSSKVNHPPEGGFGSTAVIEALNEIFRIGGMPYYLTDYVKVEEDESGSVFPGGRTSGYQVIRTVAYPKIIVVEEEMAYEEAVRPALAILGHPHFAVANTELRDGLEHYREGRYKECLTSCGSALESVLKVICDRKRWDYSHTDTLGDLLDSVVPKLDLPQVFSEKFKLVATIRNTFSASHGGGKAPRDPARHLAQYMVTTTAATIVFLVATAEGR